MGDHAPRRRGLNPIADAADIFPARAEAPEALEAGRRLFARECRFVAGAGDAAALPAESIPEIAFIGRSNVGKSSLVNALTGRRTLARISQTPGRTRQINFFNLGDRLMLVDLPGYGYAAAAKSAVKAWTALVQRYLRQRASLRRACLLIDARHGIMAADRPVLRLCDEAAVSFQVILTKSDKLRPSERAAIAEQVAVELLSHGAAYPELHLTSAADGGGIAALRAALAGFAAPAALASPQRSY